MNRYISVTLPVPDAKASVVLAGPKGACIYKIKDESKELVSDKFILQHVLPGIEKVMGPGLALFLGQALLWAAILAPERVPDRIRARVLNALGAVEPTRRSTRWSGFPSWRPALVDGCRLWSLAHPRREAETEAAVLLCRSETA